MDSDLEHISIEFHNQAKKVFFSHIRDFNASVERVDRERDENSFRLQREKYVQSLQYHLKSVAAETLNRNRVYKNISQLSQNLNHFIADYIHMFIQKIKSM